MIRSLDQLLIDLDTRQRQVPGSKNRPIQKFTSVADTIGLSSDLITTTIVTPPFVWAPADPGSTAQELAWSQGQWAPNV